ncbi:calmodulin-lysine N-methyltransferase isoform X2 [Oratosquilla oratoria]
MCKFRGFGLICMTSIKENWYAVTCLNSSLQIYTRLIRRGFSPSQLMGFNNTGNICIWPSEELLTYYCLGNLHLFKGKSVLELGGGMTCLAGMFLGMSGIPSHVLVTDGNKACIENVQVILKENPSPSPVQAGVLRWECGAEVKAQEGKFDVVICGDCVFFDDSRDNLLRTLVSVLRPGGMGLVVAPARRDTFKLFAHLCEAYFKVTTYESYDEVVAKCVEKCTSDSNYNRNLHYPLLMVLHKPDVKSS